MKKTIIQCNMCGAEMGEADIKNGLSTQRYSGTGFIYANKAMRLDLCCDCLDNLIDLCKISPICEVCEDDQTDVTPIEYSVPYMPKGKIKTTYLPL